MTVVTPSRLDVVLEPAALLRVLDRLVVLDLLPDVLRFERPKKGDAVLQLEWENIDAAKAVNLRARLAQLPSVVMVCPLETECDAEGAMSVAR
jgi:hypothetical protein